MALRRRPVLALKLAALKDEVKTVRLRSLLPLVLLRRVRSRTTVGVDTILPKALPSPVRVRRREPSEPFPCLGLGSPSHAALRDFPGPRRGPMVGSGLGAGGLSTSGGSDVLVG